jgi:hypothetical protein
MWRASEMKRKWFTSVIQKLERTSVDDLKVCQVGSNESSYCQVGNEMGSLGDLINYQVGRREEIPNF